MKLQFSGHETFPLRQLWLMKAVRYTKKAYEKNPLKGPEFSGEEAMIDLGVGKNMVASIRFWSLATGLLERHPLGNLYLTPLSMILSELDPYGEDPSTAWVIHWNLASSADKLTVFWFLFNHVNRPSLTRLDLQQGLAEFAAKNKVKVSELSIKRDIEVCLRSYLPMLGVRNKKKMSEEFVEPLLGDLEIIGSSSRDVIDLNRNARPTLNDGIFAYALLDFWRKLPGQTATLDFNHIAHAIGAPGRVFKIDENSLVQRLENLEALTNGELIWTEQAGVRTVIRKNQALNDPQSYMVELLEIAYK